MYDKKNPDRVENNSKKTLVVATIGFVAYLMERGATIREVCYETGLTEDTVNELLAR